MKKTEENKHTITIDGTDIKISNKSYQEIKEKLVKNELKEGDIIIINNKRGE